MASGTPSEAATSIRALPRSQSSSRDRSSSANAPPAAAESAMRPPQHPGPSKAISKKTATPRGNMANLGNITSSCFENAGKEAQKRHEELLGIVRELSSIFSNVGNVFIRENAKLSEYIHLVLQVMANMDQKLGRVEKHVAGLEIAFGKKEDEVDKHKADRQKADIIREILHLPFLEQDVVKLHVAFEFLDSQLRSNLYMEHEDGSNLHSFLASGAKVILGETATEEMVEELLGTSHEMQVGNSSKTRTIGFYASQGQSKAQDSIRDHAVRAFMDACPSGSALRSTSGATKEQKKTAATDLFNCSTHKLSALYFPAWKNACFHSILEAHCVVESCTFKIRAAYPEASLHSLPAPPVANGNVTTCDLEMNIYSFSFVTMKISKALKRISAVSGSGGMNGSDVYLWINEVKHWNSNLFLSLAGEIEFGSIKISSLPAEQGLQKIINRATPGM